MLYHYTDRLSGAEILRDKAIRPFPITFHRDLLGRDAGFQTPPLIWLSTIDGIDGTVAAKMVAAGWPKSLVGDVWRFGVRADYPAERLAEYIDARGIDPHWCKLAVQTGAMAGSHHSTWRLVSENIPAAEWLAVEVLASLGNDGTAEWRPADERAIIL